MTGGTRLKFTASVGAGLVIVLALVSALMIGNDGASAAPSLITNGDFATTIAGWSVLDGDTALAHSAAEDADGNNPTSGSAEVSRLTEPGTATVISACITLTGAGSYPLEAMIQLPTANVGTTTSLVSVQTYSDACITPTGVAQDSTTVGESAGWQAVSGTVTVGVLDTNAIVSLVILGADIADLASFDNVALSNGVLGTDTPSATDTPTEIPTATDTTVPTATDTTVPTATDTTVPTATDTTVPTATDTTVPTATDTTAPTATDTSVPTATDTTVPTATDTTVPTATDTTVPTATDTTVPTATDTTVPTATDTTVPTETSTSIVPLPTDTTVPAATGTTAPSATSTLTLTPTDDDPTNTHTATATASSENGAPVETVSETITFLGGTIESSTGETVEFPPGSIDGSVVVTMRLYEPEGSSLPPPVGMEYASLIVELSPEGESLSPPATLTIPFSPNAEGSIAGAAIYQYVNGAWVRLGGIVDANAMTVSVNISEFGTYAVILDAAAQPPASAPELPAAVPPSGVTGLVDAGTGDSSDTAAPWMLGTVLLALGLGAVGIATVRRRTHRTN